MSFIVTVGSLLLWLSIAGVVQAASIDDSGTETSDTRSSQTDTGNSFNQQQSTAPSGSTIAGPSTDVRSSPHEINVAGKFPLFVSGYVQGRFTDEQGTKYPYRIKRARLIVDAVLTDWADVFVQVDPTFRPGIVMDAYLQLRVRPAANFRFGAFKIPFGGESLMADERTIPIERSLVVNSFSPARDNGNQARDVGAEMLGHAGGRGRSAVEYAIAAVNGSGVNGVLDRHAVAGAARLIFHPIAGLSVGGDYYQGKTQTTLPVLQRREELEGGYKAGRFTTWGEYLRGNDGRVHRSGGYALMAYRFDGHWEAFVRAEQYNADRSKAGRITRLYEAGSNYYVTNRIRVQANYGARKDPSTGDLSPVFLVQLQIGL